MRIPVQHQLTNLRVSNPVVQNLLPAQAVVIHANVIDVDAAVIGADGDSNRTELGETFAAGILDRTGHDAVDVHQNQTVLVLFLHNDGQPDMLVVLVQRADLILSAFEYDVLRSNADANIICKTGQQRNGIVGYLSGGKLNLDGLAGCFEVVLKHLIRDYHAGIVHKAKNIDAVSVVLPTIQPPAEVLEFRFNVTVFPFRPGLLIVAASLRIQV